MTIRTPGESWMSREDGPFAFPTDAQQGLVLVLVEHQGQRLEPLNDLVDIFQDGGHGLVLVDDAVHPEGPHRGAAQRGQQQPPKRVAQGVAEPPLERLQPELGDVRIVLPLGHFDHVGADQAGHINRHAVSVPGYFE